MTVSEEGKLAIVRRLMELWAPRPNDTLMQVYPSEGWPESIRNCTLREFITQVFNANPMGVKLAVDDVNASADTYMEAVVRSVSVDRPPGSMPT
jgi:predicted RNA-binding Zn ribbon-like protein